MIHLIRIILLGLKRITLMIALSSIIYSCAIQNRKKPIWYYEDDQIPPMAIETVTDATYQIKSKEVTKQRKKYEKTQKTLVIISNIVFGFIIIKFISE